MKNITFQCYITIYAILLHYCKMYTLLPFGSAPFHGHTAFLQTDHKSFDSLLTN